MRHISNTFFIKQYLGYQTNYEKAIIERCNDLNVEPFDILGTECKHSIKIENGKLYFIYTKIIIDDPMYIIVINNKSLSTITLSFLIHTFQNNEHSKNN